MKKNALVESEDQRVTNSPQMSREQGYSNCSVHPHHNESHLEDDEEDSASDCVVDQIDQDPAETDEGDNWHRRVTAPKTVYNELQTNKKDINISHNFDIHFIVCSTHQNYKRSSDVIL